MGARLKAPPNARKVESYAYEFEGQKRYSVKINAPVGGPITCDEAMEFAAHLVVVARAGSKLKVSDLIKAILYEEKKRDGARSR